MTRNGQYGEEETDEVHETEKQQKKSKKVGRVYAWMNPGKAEKSPPPLSTSVHYGEIDPKATKVSYIIDVIKVFIWIVVL